MKRLFFSIAAFFVVACVFAGDDLSNPNSYTGTDSERIAQALEAASKSGGLVRIPPRVPDEISDRNYWLLDSAILVRANTTLILENCTLKLSDACRDNFIRSANCGIGIEKVEPIENVRVVGIGSVTLEGADRPRATGDSGKTLGERTYGTDAGKEGESQKGDWRNIGVLLANVRNFSIENISIVNAHAWSVSLEKCSFGAIRNIRFESVEQRTIDGKTVRTLNVDGLDLRKGCHNITIENITGTTGDDLVACTAIGADGRRYKMVVENGSLVLIDRENGNVIR